MMTYPFNRQRGFTLLEMTVVLILVTVLVAAIWIAAAAVNRTRKDTRSVEQIVELDDRIKTLYSAKADARDMNQAYLVRSGAIPLDMLDESTGNPAVVDLVNPWSGSVVIGPLPPQNLSYHIDYNQIPVAACIKLATGMMENLESMGILMVTINSAVAYQENDPANTAELLTPAKATTLCNSNRNQDGTTSVIFRIWLRR